jgi:hypothetical protein
MHLYKTAMKLEKFICLRIFPQKRVIKQILTSACPPCPAPNARTADTRKSGAGAAAARKTALAAGIARVSPLNSLDAMLPKISKAEQQTSKEQ